MANPIKAVKAVKKITNRNRNKTTTGKVKAFNKGSSKSIAETIGAKKKVRIIGDNDSFIPTTQPPGSRRKPLNKNKNITKEAERYSWMPPYTSRRGALKFASKEKAFQKHPLIRNTGESSAEGKYRGNRGKPIPVKRLGK